MTTGPYTVAEVEDAGNAACTCDNCDWRGTAEQTVDINDCALTPGDASPVGRCPECEGLVYLDQPLRGESADQRLLTLVADLADYLRAIRAEELDGSEPNLVELLDRAANLQRAFDPADGVLPV